MDGVGESVRGRRGRGLGGGRCCGEWSKGRMGGSVRTGKVCARGDER